MQYNSSISKCEICHLHRQKGDHSACSKEKQRLASLKVKTKRRAPTVKTYENQRLLTGFLRTIE